MKNSSQFLSASGNPNSVRAVAGLTRNLFFFLTVTNQIVGKQTFFFIQKQCPIKPEECKHFLHERTNNRMFWILDHVCHRCLTSVHLFLVVCIGEVKKPRPAKNGVRSVSTSRWFRAPPPGEVHLCSPPFTANIQTRCVLCVCVCEWHTNTNTHTRLLRSTLGLKLAQANEKRHRTLTSAIPRHVRVQAKGRRKKQRQTTALVWLRDFRCVWTNTLCGHKRRLVSHAAFTWSQNGRTSTGTHGTGFYGDVGLFTVNTITYKNRFSCII